MKVHECIVFFSLVNRTKTLPEYRTYQFYIQRIDQSSRSSITQLVEHKYPYLKVRIQTIIDSISLK